MADSKKVEYGLTLNHTLFKALIIFYELAKYFCFVFWKKCEKGNLLLRFFELYEAS